MCCPCKKSHKEKFLFVEKNLKTYDSEIEVTENEEHIYEVTENEIPIEYITEIIDEIIFNVVKIGENNILEKIIDGWENEDFLQKILLEWNDF